MRDDRRILGRIAVVIGVHLAFFAAWQLWVMLGEIPRYVMATPAETFATLSGNYAWIENTAVTAAAIFGGFWLAVAVGVVLAVLFSWSDTLRTLVMPLLVSLNMVPKVALGPIFIVWFSFGIVPNIIIAFTICFLPILITMARGLNEIEPELLDLVRAHRASRWQVFRKIQLPGSLPYLFSGMKVAVVLAVAGAIVGEFIASSAGLGYLILQVQVTQDMAGMFMAVILITLIGVALYGLVLLLEWLFVVRDARMA
ncbi:MAG: ABC transporter permease [Alphaproteobacteria bacterium]